MRPRLLLIAATLLLAAGCGQMMPVRKSCTTSTCAGQSCPKVAANDCWDLPDLNLKKAPCRQLKVTSSVCPLPSAHANCDCMVCQMVFQARFAQSIHEQQDQGCSGGGGTQLESPLTSDQEIGQTQEVGIARLPSVDSEEQAIQNVIASLHEEDCDCRACELMAASRAAAVENLDECESGISDTLPPPARLEVPPGGFADSHVEYDSDDEKERPERETPDGCPLALEQVACAAARQSAIANLLTKENQIVGQQQNEAQSRRSCLSLRNNCEDPCATAMRRKVMCYQALEQRNESAANALKLYLAIAEAEHQSPLIDDALEELEKKRASNRRVKKRKIGRPARRHGTGTPAKQTDCRT